MSDYVIPEEQIKDFERDGAICLRGFVDQTWLERLRGSGCGGDGYGA